MKVGVLGLGFMGGTHVKAWGAVEGVTLAYGSVESVLADTSIDAVDICLPTDMHAAVAIAALRAGKHVLAEKPMALDFASAEQMCVAANEAGRLLMVAHVLRFVPDYRALAEFVRGRKVESAVFRRRCGVPGWSRWLQDPARSGGPVLDLLIHDFDFCLSVWGMPEAVSATGEIVHAELLYPGMSPVVVEGGWYPDSDYPFSMGFTVMAEGRTIDRQDIEVGDAFADELRYFGACVTGGQEPDFCPPKQSAQAVALARFMLESLENNGTIVRTS